MTHIDGVGFDGLISLQSFGADEITEIQISDLAAETAPRSSLFFSLQQPGEVWSWNKASYRTEHGRSDCTVPPVVDATDASQRNNPGYG